MQIPEQGWKKEEVFATLQSYKAYDLDWKSGRVWAYVYDPGDETAQVVRDAYNMFLTENGLDPTVFPSMLKLETDIVRMTANLLTVTWPDTRCCVWSMKASMASRRGVNHRP